MPAGSETVGHEMDIALVQSGMDQPKNLQIIAKYLMLKQGINLF
jgi:hypothetical protein